MDSIETFVNKFAEAQPQHLGKPTTPPQVYHQRSETEVVIILADGRKVIADPTKPIVQPKAAQADGPSQEQIALMEKIAELMGKIDRQGQRIQELEAREGVGNKPATLLTAETVNDGINEAEATLAGKALQASKKKTQQDKE